MNSMHGRSLRDRLDDYLNRPIGRWTYFWQGFLLVALKYNLDRLIAWVGFGRSWYAWNYVEPSRHAAVDVLKSHVQGFYVTLLLVALPFLGLGILLTLRRLRSMGLSWGWCLLFFAPIVNVFFFLALCVIPGGKGGIHAGKPQPSREGRVKAALGSIFIVGLSGVGLVIIGVKVLHNYGWGLFVALPFALGLTAVVIYGYRRPRDFLTCMIVAVMPLFFIGIGLVAIAFEGLVCILMAAPIALGLALVGGMVGYAIQNSRHAGISSRLAACILGSVPCLMGMESHARLEAPLLQVTSSLDIDAPPEKVWPNVVAFSPIPPPREWLFQTGIAYPTHARIDGQGVGAVRHCVFTTGEFVEPVEVWDAPRLLKFSVADQPEPLEELSPYPHIHPPHLHGYMVSREGQLRLIPLAGGRTRLEGTTWYTNRIWPVAYWQGWTDFIIHRIHLRVMNHIKELSET